MSQSSSRSLSALFSPLILSPSITLPHRIIMGNLTRNRALPFPPSSSSAPTIPTALTATYYAQRARGGAALILSEGTLVSRQGTEWPYAPGIWSEEHVEGWRRVTEAVHREGGLIFCQLWHVGRVAHPDMPEQKLANKPVPAPSAISARGGKFRILPGTPGYVTPVAVEDPTTLLEEYRNAAIKAKAAGFDGVELQSSGGYLPHQFLDTSSNKRTDKWGGSVENRARFTLEALHIMVDVWGADRVGMKLMPAGGMNDLGMPLADTLETYNYLLEEVDKLDLAYIQLLCDGEVFDDDGEKRATKIDVLKTFGPKIKNARLILNGGNFTIAEAAALVAAGTVDAVAFGRKMLNNPDLANRLIKGLPLDTVPLDFRTSYQWEKSPEEGYTDIVPVGGFITA